MMILAGDIGGTKTVIAHYEEWGGSLRQLRVATFKSREHPSLEHILAAYLKDSPGLSLKGGLLRRGRYGPRREMPHHEFALGTRRTGVSAGH